MGCPAWLSLDKAITIDENIYASIELCEETGKSFGTTVHPSSSHESRISLTGASRLFPGISIASYRHKDGKYAILPVPPPMPPFASAQISPAEYSMYRLTRTGTSAFYPGIIFTTAYHR